MPAINQLADALACLINKAVASKQYEELTCIREAPFAIVAVAPHVARIKARKLHCFVEPVSRRINDAETQDACSGEWLNTVAIVFAQRLDDIGNDENQPDSICEIRKLIDFVESIGEKFTAEWQRVNCGGEVARIEKPDIDHEILNREWIRDHSVFYSQINVTYG